MLKMVLWHIFVGEKITFFYKYLERNTFFFVKIYVTTLKLDILHFFLLTKKSENITD